MFDSCPRVTSQLAGLDDFLTQIASVDLEISASEALLLICLHFTDTDDGDQHGGNRPLVLFSRGYRYWTYDRDRYIQQQQRQLGFPTHSSH